ncbi:hypothetical protein KI387_013251, partial [Taxus chinensis]
MRMGCELAEFSERQSISGGSEIFPSSAGQPGQKNMWDANRPVCQKISPFRAVQEIFVRDSWEK